MSERLMAQGRLQELRLQAEELRMTGEEYRRALREATGPIVALENIDSARVIYLSGHLAKAVEDRRKVVADMAAIRKEYGL